MRERRFVPFLNKRDHIDPIAAEHVNRLQRVSEDLQEESFRINDEAFLRKALDFLEHRHEFNVLWVDLLKDPNLWNWRTASAVRYSEKEFALCLDEESHALVGSIQTVAYSSVGGAILRDFSLLAQVYTPPGTAISFFYSTDGKSFFPIQPNQDPVTPKNSGSSFVLKVEFQRQDDTAPSPRLDAVAVAFFDPSRAPEFLPPTGEARTFRPVMYHSELLGIGPDDHHPKIHRHTGEPGEPPKIDLEREVVGILWWEHLPPDLLRAVGIIKPGEIILERDDEGRLIHVVAPEGEDFLIYDELGRLFRAVNVQGEKVILEELYYSDEGDLVRIKRDVLEGSEIDLSALGYGG